MKKIYKYSFILVIIALISKMIAQELFDNRPFKFEKYRSYEALEGAAKANFLIGDNIDEMIKRLEKSGAECHIYKNADPSKNYEISATCEYEPDFFSFYPFEWYRIDLDGDKNNKLIGLESNRTAGFWW